MKPSGWNELLISAILFVLSAFVPFAMMYLALATSWAVFSGPTHYISLTTGAFFGVGGYMVGAGMSDYGMSF